MSRIAVYGKGGIGKSTISANLSVALAMRGETVLQIGCDPKHDSTRLLLHGARVTTALDYLRETSPLDYRLSDVLHEGYLGIGCVEAGGPKPGVGCAGRGIISTFELLERFDLRGRYTMTVYDVLGDVVCGGFAVPIRREYADTILIVTSGEFMALYAANNILRGILNYDGDERRVAGLVYNRRDVAGEDARVKRFATAVGLPVFATLPRSDTFTRAERANVTAMELNDEPEVTAVFEDMAGRLSGECELYAAHPLDDDELEHIVLGAEELEIGTGFGTGEILRCAQDDIICAWNDKACARDDNEGASSCHPERSEGSHIAIASRSGQGGDDANASTATDEKGALAGAAEQGLYLSKNLIKGEPLHGCAFNGALCTAVHLKDAVVLAHSPTSCAYISYQTISSSGRRTLFERGSLLPVPLAPNLRCTEMGEPEIVFGGMERLEERLAETLAENPAAVVVVSSCPAGIIGDDIDKAVDAAQRAMESNCHPERSEGSPATMDDFAKRACASLGTITNKPSSGAPDAVPLQTDSRPPIVAIKADGNMAGDYLQGMFMAYTQIARALVDPSVARRPRTVNVIAEKMVVTNTEANFELVSGWLARMGVEVNCRFLYNATVEQVREFCAAEVTLPAYGDYTAQTLARLFSHEYGCEVFDRGFPIGFDESCAWLRAVGARFGVDDEAERIIVEEGRRYREQIERVCPQLEGRSLMVITFNSELDWILKAALDAGMEIAKICVLDYSQDEGFRSRLDVELPIELSYDPANRIRDIAELAPDVLLTNYASSIDEGVPVSDTIPMCPDAGFNSGIRLVERWARLLRMDLKGEWKLDERLYREHLA